MTTQSSNEAYEPTGEDLAAYMALPALDQQAIAPMFSRVQRLNNLATELELFPAITFRWLRISQGAGKQQRWDVQMYDRRDPIERKLPLPLALRTSPDIRGVRVQILWQQEQQEQAARQATLSLGLQQHVYEMLPGVRIAAIDTPCSFDGCGLLLENPIHVRMNVRQSAYDRAQRIAERAGVELDVDAAFPDPEDDGDRRTSSRREVYGTLDSIPAGRVEQRHVVEYKRDEATGKLLHHMVKGKLRPIVLKEYDATVNVPSMLTPMKYDEPASTPADVGPGVEPGALGIFNPRGRGRMHTAWRIDIDTGRRIERVTYWDISGPVVESPWSPYDEQRAEQRAEQQADRQAAKTER